MINFVAIIKANKRDKSNHSKKQQTHLLTNFSIYEKTQNHANIGPFWRSIGGGCSDYDDDIKSLNNRVDELTNTVALKADASAVTALQQRFDAIDFSKFATNDALAAAIDGLKSTYVTKSDLNSELAKYASQDDLKNVQDQIDAIIRDYAKKTDVDKVQTALDAYKQSVDAVLGGLDGKSVAEYVAAQMAILNGRIETVEGDITIINGQIETINGNIETVNRRIEALEGISFVSPEDLAQAVTKLEGAIAACVKSEDLPGILEDYATKTWVEEAIEAYIEAALNDQIAKAIDTKIADAEKTIKEDVLVLVGDQFGSYMSEYLSDTESVKELLGVTSGDVLKQMQNSDSEFAKAIIKLANDSMGEDINTAKVDIEDIKKQLAAHEERLNGLDEVVSALKGRIQAIVNVPMDSYGRTVVDNYQINGKYLWGDKVSAVLTYHVAPAVKVAQIVKAYNEKDANWTFSILDEELTRAAQTAILGMEEVDGKLAVKVSIPNNDGKKHALALQVDYKTVNETGDELDDATAISDFACIYKKNVNCEIQLGTFAEDGKFTEAPAGAVSHEIEYTSKEPVSVKMDYAVYDTSNKKYMTIEEVNKMIKEAEGSEEDVLSVDYTVEPQFAGEEDPLRKAFVYDEGKLEVTLGEEANLNIGETLTLKAAVKVNLNGEKLSPITKDIDVTIIGKNGGDIIVNDMTMPWTYEAATGGIDFDAEPYKAVFATDYTAAEGNPTLAEILAGDCTSSEVMNAKDEAVTGAAIELTGAEGGLQIRNISGITEFWGSTFTFVNVYQYKNDSHEIVYRVKGKIAFAAKPALPHGKNPEPIVIDITSAAENVVEAVDWAKIMEVEGFDAANYGGLDNFIAGIQIKSVKKYLNDEEKELASDADVRAITIDPVDVARNRDCVKMEVEYVYVEGEVETPIAEITVAATVKLDGYTIVSNSHYVDNNKVNVQATLVGDYWAWDEANLNNYFTYNRPTGATEEMEFSVTTVEGEAEGKDAATLTADNKLDFTNATTRKANVHAEVKVGHIVVAEHDIEVTANALFKEMTVKPANWTSVIGETHDFDLRNCVEVIDAKGNCYDAENGAVTRIPEAKVTFVIPENDEYFEKTDDYTVRFKSADNAPLLKPITIEVTAVYADKFETTEKKITITVNPAN